MMNIFEKCFPGYRSLRKEKKFQEMAALGKQLANLHLMHEPIPIKLELSETPPDKWIIRNYTYSASENTLYFDDPTKYSVSNNMDLPWIKGITQMYGHIQSVAFRNWSNSSNCVNSAPLKNGIACNGV